MEVDDYGGDELDTIPDNTLRALEQHAISSTQAAKSNGRRVAAYDAASSARNHLNGDTHSTSRHDQPQQADHGQSAHSVEPPSSDYGFDDEDVIDLDEPSMMIRPNSLPWDRAADDAHPDLSLRFGSRPALDPETQAAFAAADADLGAHGPVKWAASPRLPPEVSPELGHGADLSSLRARIATLEAEQTRLQQAERDARDALMAKQGEISIVRANQENVSKEYERRIAVMQKLHADETLKHKADLDAGRKEREKMETDNRFLQHDLMQEAERSKRLTGPGKTRTAVGLRHETPRKAKRTALGDGFDDDELHMASPSRSQGKSREQTPKTGAKRKRQPHDSPAPALSFTEPTLMIQHADSSVGETPASDISFSATYQGDSRYEIMQRLLCHTHNQGHVRTVEEMTKHFFPSAPNKSLSSILMDGLSPPSIASPAEIFPLQLCRVLFTMWGQCLQEKHYMPMGLLLDLVQFSLRFELPSVVSTLLEELVPLCIKSIDIVVIPMVRASTDRKYAAELDLQAHEKLAEQINVDDVLSLLQNVCEAATLSSERTEAFWRTFDFEFTLFLMNKAQHLSHIRTALQILATSALPTTFGQIALDVGKQGAQERNTIDRLTNLLFETPEAPKDEPPHTEEEVLDLRMDVLKVFKAMCLSQHGGLRLAQNRTAIGRMFRFLEEQVNALYATRPSIVDSPPASAEESSMSSQPNAHDLVARNITTTVLLLYYLLKNFDTIISFTAKTSAVKGSFHRFIVAMTRIAFADQLVLDAGIDTHAIDAAHTILDNILSPEEGEAVVRAVETPRGTRTSEITQARSGSTTQRNTRSDEDVAMNDDGG